MVVDTSAILAISFKEPTAVWLSRQIAQADHVLISTVNLAEALIIFRDRHPADAISLQAELLAAGFQFIPPNTAQAIIAAKARFTFPLNFGDCFAYALAKTSGAQLLFKGEDFSRTDLV
jgi:ribonuclease VapC